MIGVRGEEEEKKGQIIDTWKRSRRGRRGKLSKGQHLNFVAGRIILRLEKGHWSAVGGWDTWGRLMCLALNETNIKSRKDKMENGKKRKYRASGAARQLEIGLKE